MPELYSQGDDRTVSRFAVVTEIPAKPRVPLEECYCVNMDIHTMLFTYCRSLIHASYKSKPGLQTKIS